MSEDIGKDQSKQQIYDENGCPIQIGRIVLSEDELRKQLTESKNNRGVTMKDIEDLEERLNHKFNQINKKIGIVIGRLGRLGGRRK